MKNVKEIKIEVKGKEWESALDKAWNKVKSNVKVDGFRKGAVTKEIYIKKVGIESLFMDACDAAMNEAYPKVLKDNKDLELACEPSVNIDTVDKDHVAFTFTIISKPEVKLGKYRNLGIKKEEVKVSKEEVAHEIEHIVGHMAEVVVKENGKVVSGNVAVIDFDGVVDGKALEGGSGKGYELEIGSNSFIPGFEDGVIGMEIGETKVLKLKFPKDYTEELKNKDVEFTVKVTGIKERVLPEMNKDFFEDLGIEGVDSKEKLEAYVKDEMTHQKSHQAEDKYIDELLRTATENMKVEINPEIIDSETDRIVHEYSHQLQSQGLSIEQYLSFTGGNMEDLRNMMKPQAEARIKTRYLLEEVVKAEKIECTKAEMKAEIKKMTEAYGIDEKQLLDSVGGEEGIKYQIEMQKAVDIIKEA